MFCGTAADIENVGAIGATCHAVFLCFCPGEACLAQGRCVERFEDFGRYRVAKRLLVGELA